jgi:hypothetical protein
MEAGDTRRELQHQWRGQPAGARHLVEQLMLLEAPHHDDPIKRRPVVTPPNRSVRLPADRPDLQIQLRRGAAVQRQLRLARRPPQLRRRKIEVGVFDRALQLVGIVTGEKHDRDVRLDSLNHTLGETVGSGPAQERDDLVLRVPHRRSVAHYRAVIASEAKQSPGSECTLMGIASSLRSSQ